MVRLTTRRDKWFQLRAAGAVAVLTCAFLAVGLTFSAGSTRAVDGRVDISADQTAPTADIESPQKTGELAPHEMDHILAKAKECRDWVAERAKAHYISAEDHRETGVQWGVMSIVLSTIVGSAIFMTIASRLGVPGVGSPGAGSPGAGSPPSKWWLVARWPLMFLLSAGLIAAPVTTGLQTFLKDAEQAARHEASWAGYYHAQQQLDLFLLRYSNVDSTPETREEALKKLEQITNDIDTVNSNSITLTERAWKAARKLGH